MFVWETGENHRNSVKRADVRTLTYYDWSMPVHHELNPQAEPTNQPTSDNKNH